MKTQELTIMVRRDPEDGSYAVSTDAGVAVGLTLDAAIEATRAYIETTFNITVSIKE